MRALQSTCDWQCAAVIYSFGGQTRISLRSTCGADGRRLPIGKEPLIFLELCFRVRDLREAFQTSG